MMREEVLASVARIGGRLGELRLDTELDISHGVVRYLELLKLAALIQRRRAEHRGRPRRHQRAPARRHDTAAARDPRDLDARRDPARRRSRRRHDRPEQSRRPRPRGRSPARSLLARALPAAHGDRAGAVGLGRRDLPRLPAALQVRARPAHPDRADHQPALRDRRAPGARALPLRRGAGARADARAARGRLAAGRLRRRRARARALRKARAALARYHERLRGSAPSRCGSSARSPSGSGRTTCADASTASTGSPGRRRRRAVRADRLQDLAPEERRAAAGRHPAVAVRARRPRGLEARDLPPGLLLRARRPEGARALARTRDPGAVGDTVLEVGEGILAQGSSRPLARGLLDLRLPDRLPGGGAVPGPALKGQSATAARPKLCPRGADSPGRPMCSRGAALAQEALEFAREHVPGGHVLRRELCLVALGRLLQAFDERLDVGVALHGQPDLALVVAGGRPPARRRRRRRRSGLPASAPAPAPPSGWWPRRRSGGRRPTGSPTGSPASRRRCAGRRRCRSAPRSSRAQTRGAPSAPGRRRSRSSRPGAYAGTSPSSAPSETTTCTPSASARSTRCALNARQRIDGSTPCTSTRSRGARGARASKTSTDGQTISRALAAVELDRGPVGLEVVELLGVDPREALGVQRGGEEGDGARGCVAGVVPALERAHHRRGPQAIRTAVPDQRLHPNHRTSCADDSAGCRRQRHERARQTVATPATRSEQRSTASSPARARSARSASRHAVPDGRAARQHRLDRRAGVPRRGRARRALRARRAGARAGRVERFREQLQIDIAGDRARGGSEADPARFLPTAAATSTSSKGSSSTSRARSTTRA